MARDDKATTLLPDKCSERLCHRTKIYRKGILYNTCALLPGMSWLSSRKFFWKTLGYFVPTSTSDHALSVHSTRQTRSIQWPDLYIMDILTFLARRDECPESYCHTPASASASASACTKTLTWTITHKQI